MKKFMAVIAGLLIAGSIFAQDVAGGVISGGFAYQNIETKVGSEKGNLQGLNIADLQLLVVCADNLVLEGRIGLGYLESDEFVYDRDAGAFTTLNGCMGCGFSFINTYQLKLVGCGFVGLEWMSYSGQDSYGKYTHTMESVLAGVDATVIFRLSQNWGISATGAVMTTLGGTSTIEDRNSKHEDNIYFGGYSYAGRIGISYFF